MRIFGLSCLLAVILLIPGCGNVFVSGSWGGQPHTMRGVVSIVRFTVVSDGNGSTQVTVVTLTNNFGSITESFCGDQRTRFPFDNFVQASFQPGQPCSTLFNVVIIVN
jgi:hypothetical protein